ncbi:hypothetical protein RUND412_003049 [Rhizina undulata]
MSETCGIFLCGPLTTLIFYCFGSRPSSISSSTRPEEPYANLMHPGIFRYPSDLARGAVEEDHGYIADSSSWSSEETPLLDRWYEYRRENRDRNFADSDVGFETEEVL